MYTELYRNQYHFSPPESWMSEPSGLIYFEEDYHLFYQYSPDDNSWGPMHWGHAVSKDLMHWSHLPVAILSDELGYIFSGSVVLDWNNSSGFGNDGKPALVAIFTQHHPKRKILKTGDHEKQSLAYSNDNGLTWTKYSSNPIIPNSNLHFDFRDPKVFWSDDYEQWILVLALKDRVQIYGSNDLKSWIFKSEWGSEYQSKVGAWGQPDMYKIKVADTEDYKWVLQLSTSPGGPNGGSGMQYFVGDFDGNTFKVEPGFERLLEKGAAVVLDYGPDAFAGVTWSGIPKADGRRLQMSWMSNWEYAEKVPTFPWRSAMGQAKEITLHKIDGQYQLMANTINELSNIETDMVAKIQGRRATENQVLVEGLDTGLYRLQIEFFKQAESVFALKFYNDAGEMMILGFDGQTNNYFIDRSKSGEIDFSTSFGEMIFGPLQYEKDTIKWEVLVDRGALEVIADDGLLNMSSIYFAKHPLDKISLIIAGEEVEIIDGKVTILQSIWD